jgi:hypothetical protein
MNGSKGERGQAQVHGCKCIRSCHQYLTGTWALSAEYSRWRLLRSPRIDYRFWLTRMRFAH